ncbi:TetR/AcrR family transcriptional regulator [Nocardia panacis]|uniref:TetR/AcrR family transcriptional regulator n=1 Tax=Nocardia panacis TaxID=2340916 RepID=A0A3A4KLL7_9NOCA|nr:TetR/AcrR family transcriptional regulator [Nocardia panacis]RJO75819.1 TetR/AcrR family transcriptional regulator [Nocardia panacis]
MTGPRERLIDGAIELVREQGVTGAGLTALLTRTGTSRNSLYQHFPAGKGELVAAATDTAGARMTALLDRFLAAGPREFPSALVDWWRKNLIRGEFGAGCPIAGAALAESEPAVQAAAAAALRNWTDQLARALTDAGVAPESARSCASFVISSFEGAIIQARALKSTTPLDDVAVQLAIVLAHHLDGVAPLETR